MELRTNNGTNWIDVLLRLRIELLFTGAGVLLILLGVTMGFEVPFLKKLIPFPDFRWVAVAVGCFLALLAFLIILFSRTRTKPLPVISPPGGEDFEEKHLMIGDTQNKILGLIIEKDPQMVNEKEIRKKIKENIPKLKASSNAHIYYRLEQLWLLKFIKKEERGYFLYGLSPEYKEYRRKDREK